MNRHGLTILVDHNQQMKLRISGTSPHENTDFRISISALYNEQLPLVNQAPLTISCQGFCPECLTLHSLGPGNCLAECRRLTSLMATRQSIDIHTPQDSMDARCHLSYLHGKARGKMFGVMETMTPNGDIQYLHAFSGQYNGLWDVKGWAPPLVNSTTWLTTNHHAEKEIKRIGRQMAAHVPHSPAWKELRLERRRMSRTLMKEIHALYTIRNFKGEALPLTEMFKNTQGIPTGTGDCCGPKLLNYAILNGLKPLGIMEFYLGKENKSGSRQPGIIYPSCKEKCQPIIGYMLCGLPPNN